MYFVELDTWRLSFSNDGIASVSHDVSVPSTLNITGDIKHINDYTAMHGGEVQDDGITFHNADVE